MKNKQKKQYFAQYGRKEETGNSISRTQLEQITATSPELKSNISKYQPPEFSDRPVVFVPSEKGAQSKCGLSSSADAIDHYMISSVDALKERHKTTMRSNDESVPFDSRKQITATSPEASCVSMKSTDSKYQPPEFSDESVPFDSSVERPSLADSVSHCMNSSVDALKERHKTNMKSKESRLQTEETQFRTLWSFQDDTRTKKIFV
ncbi:hypothetical protein Q8A67_009641 [Cirrhinus molitorella]|uniref:Uncharacterized protein n=1 Tax=Cirrhinus molitorella TaxID=172907 RepID=A0AA88PRE6_9TELE|nr:hypothetical protein Q8A67_009641 [Cirrhinus molitorella]